MPEYVTKEAVKQAMRSQPRGILFTEWELDQVPTVDAKEVVHACWIGDEPGEWQCSHCGEDAADGGFEQTEYCPHCGAIMDGGINK